MKTYRTASLGEVKEGEQYTWGQVIAIHEIGQYAVIEHHPWKTNDVEVMTGVPDESVRQFAPYVSATNIRRMYDSMDAALIGAIAWKWDGMNTRADSLIMRMLGAESST